MLAATADQVAQAVRRDRLAAAAADAEIERRSDELRSALLDSVSHDLRTPLAAIRAAAGSLADPAIELDDERRRATARAIDEEADRLNRLVGSLLDMGRIQSGALVPELEVTPLGELLDPIVERFRPQLADRLSFRIPDDLPAVHVDQTFLSQALANVLDNAATHSAPDARILVSADADGDHVEIRVEDSGPGVAPDVLPHLFERFYRAPARSKASRRGVGLGLTVVRGLIEAMGGTVGAAPSGLGGLAITVRVPAARTAPETSGMTASGSGDPPRRGRRADATHGGGESRRARVPSERGGGWRSGASPLGATASRSRDGRPRAARNQRPRSHPSHPRRRVDPHPRPVGARPGAGQGRGPRRGGR